MILVELHPEDAAPSGTATVTIGGGPAVLYAADGTPLGSNAVVYTGGEIAFRTDPGTVGVRYPNRSGSGYSVKTITVTTSPGGDDIPANVTYAIDQAIADLQEGAPQNLDEFEEIADALGDDPDFATTIANLIGTKAASVDLAAETTRAEAAEALRLIVLGAGNGTDDTAAVNAALAALTDGGMVKGKPGQTYRLSAPFAPHSATTLDMNGCKVRYADTSVRCNMLANAAATPVYTAADASCVAGSSVIHSPGLAAHATVGQQCALPAAGLNTPDGTGLIWLYGTITAVNAGAGTVTLGGNRNGVAAHSTIVSGATGYLFNRDHDITIDGGDWDFGTNWNDHAERYAAGYNSTQMRLRRIDGLTVRNAKLTGSGFPQGGGWVFGIDPGDCTDVLVENCTGNGASTVVQSSGLLYRATIRNIRGTTQDDMVALGCVGTGGADLEGDIEDVTIDGVKPNGSWTGLKMFAGLGSNNAYRVMLNVTARDIKGTTQLGAVNIVDYQGPSWIEANVEDVDVVPNLFTGALAPSVFVNCTAGQVIRLGKIRWPYHAPAPISGVGVINVGGPLYPFVGYPTTSASGILIVNGLDIRGAAGGTYQGVVVTGTASLQTLEINGVEQPEAGMTAEICRVSTAAANINYLSISKVHTQGTTTLVHNVAGGTITQMNATGYRMSGASALYKGDASGAAAAAYVSDGYCAGVNPIVTHGPMSVFMSNANFNTSGEVMKIVGAGATPCGIEAVNCYQQGAGTTLVTRDGSQVVAANNADQNATLGVDVAILTPVVGNRAFNTNTAVAVAGPVVYDATSPGWLSMTRPGAVILAYKEITDVFSTSSTAFVDVTNMTNITFKTGPSGKVKIRARAGSMSNNTNNDGGLIAVYDSANAVEFGRAGAFALSPANNAISPIIEEIWTLTPNTSYTIKLRMAAGTGGTATLNNLSTPVKIATSVCVEAVA